MKITETKLRQIVRNKLKLKKLEELSRKIVSENQEKAELGAAGKDYKPALEGEKMPTNKTEAGNYMMKAVRQVQGVTSSEVPALIQMFDDMLKTFATQNVSASKAKKLGKGAEIGKQRAGIQDN
jgi:hypothetical protein